MTTQTQTAEIVGIFSGLNDIAKRLLYEVINGISRGRLTCEEVNAAACRMHNGSNKLEELESLVDLSNHRIYNADS